MKEMMMVQIKVVEIKMINYMMMDGNASGTQCLWSRQIDVFHLIS
jgi:hypothetical protein